MREIRVRGAPWQIHPDTSPVRSATPAFGLQVIDRRQILRHATWPNGHSFFPASLGDFCHGPAELPGHDSRLPQGTLFRTPPSTTAPLVVDWCRRARDPRPRRPAVASLGNEFGLDMVTRSPHGGKSRRKQEGRRRVSAYPPLDDLGVGSRPLP